MGWVVMVSVACMLVYTTLGAKLGVAAAEAPSTLLARRVGRWLAVAIGGGVFFISASFQFGNNLGVYSAFQEYEPYLRRIPFFDLSYVIVLFNLLSITFLFAFKNLYRTVERLMMTFVALMLLSFAVNLLFAKPSIVELLLGFVPPFPGLRSDASTGDSSIDLSVLGLVGTTFVITAAYYQAYLVRQKGWGPANLQDGLVDARVSATIMGLITLMLMSTAAAQLRGQELTGVGDVAAGLKPAFGELGHALFCVGLFAAAYSSFLVNSMIGGFILADGLGLGCRPADWWPRLFTVAVLLTGMTTALLVTLAGRSPVPAIVAAQAVTVVASPLVAGALWWLTSRADIMGEHKNGLLMNLAAMAGFLMLLAMAFYTAGWKVWPEVQRWAGWG